MYFLLAGESGCQCLDIPGEILMIEDHAQAEGQGSHQNERGEDQPEPGPVFLLPGELSHRDGLKEIGAEQGQKVADGIVGTGAPDIRGVLVADGENIVVSQGDEAQLALEDLVENDEQHHQQQTCRCPMDPLVGQLVMTKS